MFDEAAIAKLYERYGYAIYQRVKRLVGQEADARELVQETFCQFVKNQGRFEGRSAPFTYLYRIATNLAIDRLRRRTTAGDQFAFEDQRDGGYEPSPSQRQDRKSEAAATLAHLCDGLDEDTLVVAVMSHVDGLTQDEIAAALDLSRRTVGKRLARFLAVTRARAGVAVGESDD